MDEQQMPPVQPVQPPQPEAPKTEGQKNMGMAVVAYILFFIPLMTDAKNDPFVKFHVKQGLVLFIGWVLVWVLGWFISFLLWPILSLLDLALFVLMVVGIINAVNGKMEPLPVVGKFADSFKF